MKKTEGRKQKAEEVNAKAQSTAEGAEGKKAAAEPPSCSTCRFWRAKANSQVFIRTATPQGLCRRYPQPAEKLADEWCGEHAAIGN